MTEAARPVVEAIAKMDNWIFGALWLYEGQDASLYCYTSWRAPMPQLSAFEKVTNEMKLPRSTGLPGRVVVSKKPAWITDLMQDSNFPRNPQALDGGLRSGFAFPTCAEGAVNGVIELYSADGLTPDTALLSAVEALGNQIGIFVHRSRTQIDLELTRLARSKLELHLHMADVHRLLRRVARRVRARFDAPSSSVHLRLDARHHHAFVDVPRLEQVFEYILANAFRFGGNGSPIVVSTTNHSTEELCIRIADNGVDIEQRYLETVFNPFEQVGPREEGLGLGLAMSRTLIKLHGGTIRAESDGLGRGTTIIVGLKLDRTYADVAA